MGVTSNMGAGWKEAVKVIVGIITGIFMMSMQKSFDNYSSSNEKLQKKIDVVYDYATNHEVRIAAFEVEIEEHKKKILDLQLAKERMEADYKNLKPNR